MRGGSCKFGGGGGCEVGVWILVWGGLLAVAAAAVVVWMMARESVIMERVVREGKL